MEELVGARWDFERDLKKIGRMVMDHIEKKRDALGINVSRRGSFTTWLKEGRWKGECKPVPGGHH